MSRTPAVDASVGWSCTRCPRKHKPGSTCPPVGIWLVSAFCRTGCSAATGHYCSRHRGRGALSVAPDDGQRRAAGERGEGE